LPVALYTESQDAAEDVISTFRQQQAEVGVAVDERTLWTMEDYAIACHAWLKPIDNFLLRLLDAAQKIFEVLWLEVAVPTSLHKLTTWLATVPGHVKEWRASAARVGAEMALSFVLSWYDEIQLSHPETRQARAVLSATELRALAYVIALYADTEEFITDPDAAAGARGSEDGDKDGEDDVEDFGDEGAAGGDEGAGDGTESSLGEPQF
jgi:hypothetical protein